MASEGREETGVSSEPAGQIENESTFWQRYPGAAFLYKWRDRVRVGFQRHG